MSETLPGYRMHETSGGLRPAIEAYLHGRRLAPQHVAAMRAYLRQWINAPGWRGPGIEELRRDIDGLTSETAINAWLIKAEGLGADPL